MEEKALATHENPCCSFCERPYRTAGPLVQGRGAYICFDCIKICLSVMAKHQAGKSQGTRDGDDPETPA